jgi:IMP dehydrogenase
MAFTYEDPSRTFSEYLLIPNKTRRDCVPANVSLRTPLVKHVQGEEPAVHLNVPFVSAIMQAVSNDTMGIALARAGGLSFIYGSQSIESQAAMVARVKNFKAGFVESTANLGPSDTIARVVEVHEETGHSTMPITEDGTAGGKLLGILTSRDYRLHRVGLDELVTKFMTPFDKLVVGKEGINLTEANDLIWDHKLNCLPIIDDDGRLVQLVFRKDYDEHKENPDELIDADKRFMVGAGINTRDHEERIPALVEAGVDAICVDSSDGFNEYQYDTIRWIKETFGDSVKVGGGNIVEADGFRYLVEAGADFVKVGVGPGSICITREQKGIGRGQASAVQDVARARDEYLEETGEYVPICSDGGLVFDYHVVLAMAMGADFVMQGRYFARFDEAPGRRVQVGGRYMKEYWGEGSNRARNWQRYSDSGKKGLAFEEGVDAYVPYAGRLRDNLNLSLTKIKSTMCNCGATSIPELQDKARMTLVSATSIREGGAHDVVTKESTDIIPEK